MEQTKLNTQDEGVDPFRVLITIVSLCNYIFRRNFMKPKSIGIKPENGYNPKQNPSKNYCLISSLSRCGNANIKNSEQLADFVRLNPISDPLKPRVVVQMYSSYTTKHNQVKRLNTTI